MITGWQQVKSRQQVTGRLEIKLAIGRRQTNGGKMVGCGGQFPEWANPADWATTGCLIHTELVAG